MQDTRVPPAGLSLNPSALVNAANLSQQHLLAGQSIPQQGLLLANALKQQEQLCSLAAHQNAINTSPSLTFPPPAVVSQAPPNPQQVILLGQSQPPSLVQQDPSLAQKQANLAAQPLGLQNKATGMFKTPTTREENSLLNQLKAQYQQQQQLNQLQELSQAQYSHYFLQQLQHMTQKQLVLQQQGLQNVNPAAFLLPPKVPISQPRLPTPSPTLPIQKLVASMNPPAASLEALSRLQPHQLQFDASRWLLTGESSGTKRPRVAEPTAVRGLTEDKRRKLDYDQQGLIKPVPVRASQGNANPPHSRPQSPVTPLALTEKTEANAADVVAKTAAVKQEATQLVEEEDEDYVKLKINVGSGEEDSRIIGKKCKWWPKRLDLRFQDITSLKVLQENNKATFDTLGQPTIRIDKTGKERLKGIYKKPDGHYKADIQVCGRSVFLGNYARKELACQAHDRVALKMYGPKLANRWPIPVQRFHYHPKFYLPDSDYINEVPIEQLIRDIREDAKIWKLKARYSNDTIKMYRSRASISTGAEENKEKALVAKQDNASKDVREDDP